MAKKTKKQVIEPVDFLKSDHDSIQRDLHLLPSNNHVKSYQVGDKVKWVMRRNIDYGIITKVYEDGKYYDIMTYSTNNKTGKQIVEERCFTWMDICDFDIPGESDYSNKYDAMKINYTNRELYGLILSAYHYGIDFDPFYQRDYVWNIDDKIALIDSIFNAADIGKFVFAETGKYSPYLEIIDGKQRMRAILDFFERKFQYNGYYFHELSVRDQRCFRSHQITYAQLHQGATSKQKLSYFILLNSTGHDVGVEHINNMKAMLKSMKD